MLQQLISSYQAQICLQNLCSSPFIGSYTNHSGVEAFGRRTLQDDFSYKTLIVLGVMLE